MLFKQIFYFFNTRVLAAGRGLLSDVEQAWEGNITTHTRRIRIDGCLHNERSNTKAEGSTRLPYTGLRGGLGHVQIETRLTGERFESVMGECAI
jgi:hypothetical protein